MTSSLPRIPIALALVLLAALPSAPAATTTEDEQTLLDAGLSGEGPALLAFFHARARRGLTEDRLAVLLDRFIDGTRSERDAATAEILGLGPLALPILRQAAGDLDHPDAAQRAQRCLRWLEGPESNLLLQAAARTLAQRHPEGAAAALLAYLPYAADTEVQTAINTALAAVAAPEGKPDPALLRGLEDALAVRRAAAGVALCRATPPERVPQVRKLLKDPAAGVRLRAALALAEAHDAEAIPVLIDLLAELYAEQRATVEEFLTRLAGEWTPQLRFESEDEVSRAIRRDAWASWWRHSDGPRLLAAVHKHTLTAETRAKMERLTADLGAESFAAREKAAKELFALRRLALPPLQQASKHNDPEVSRRARALIERIESTPSQPLPLAALRLLAVRKPAGAVEALLAYLPDAEDEIRATETQQTLTALAQRDGKLDPALLRALTADSMLLRTAALEALASGGGSEGCAAVRKYLHDKMPQVRLRAALALARAHQREAVPVLIDLLPVLPGEQNGDVEELLCQLAGDSAPESPAGTDPVAARTKSRDAWAAWWKLNANRVDLGRLTDPAEHGLTLICDNNSNRVYEVDRKGKVRWSIDQLANPLDAWVLPGNRVLIAEHGANRVTERDFTGKILWEKRVTNPTCTQRLPNGNTFIATYQGVILEVDRTGTVLYELKNLEGVRSAFRARQGVLVYLSQKGECVLANTTGKRLKAFDTHHPFNERTLDWVDRSPRGGILIAQPERNKVVEYTLDGKKLLELDAPQAMTASALPNGHILVASYQGKRVFELDRTGKVVWEYKSDSPVIRARRR